MRRCSSYKKRLNPLFGSEFELGFRVQGVQGLGLLGFRV